VGKHRTGGKRAYGGGQYESLHVRSLQISTVERPRCGKLRRQKNQLGYRDDDEFAKCTT
jgi:hypothetical protein